MALDRVDEFELGVGVGGLGAGEVGECGQGAAAPGCGGRVELLHDAYNPALNRINPISATNPNRAWYLSEAEQFLARYGGVR